MIYFDVTKASKWGHKSGVGRVSEKLLGQFPEAVGVAWDESREAFVDVLTKKPIAWDAHDWLVTVEIFSPAERKGYATFLAAKPCRCVAVFHDAIPLKFPEITWPHSVARHPGYLKMLGHFDHVWAVSDTSLKDLKTFLHWQDAESSTVFSRVCNGADFCAQRGWGGKKKSHDIVCVGILEPRKNQNFLLDVVESLWEDRVPLNLHLVGRVNPFFGRGVVERVRTLRRAGAPVTHHEKLSDEGMTKLLHHARACVFPTIAEGCGLPLIESLWAGLPCVASDIPVLRENGEGGGVLWAAPADLQAWKAALQTILTDDVAWETLSAQAKARALPTWAAAAATMREVLGG